MIFILPLIEILLSPFIIVIIILAFGISKRRRILIDLLNEIPERLGFIKNENKQKLLGKEVWWFHAASAGEVYGLFPLFDQLKLQTPPPAIVVTTMTRTGREVAQKHSGVTFAQLAPIDIWPVVSFFISQINIKRLLLTETELWPSLISVSFLSGLRPTLINARMTETSFKRYRLIKYLLLPILRSLEAILAQSPEDAERFENLGLSLNKLMVTGNSKYDRQLNTTVNENSSPLQSLGWNSSLIILGVSTHYEDESALISSYLKILGDIPKLKLILAPRHIERINEVEALLRSHHLKFARYSSISHHEEHTAVLLIDQMGVLGQFWNVATVAFVGGTLSKTGGHNLLEPALYSIPVLFGPHLSHVEFQARKLVEGKGGIKVTDTPSLSATLTMLLSNPLSIKSMGQRAKLTAAGLRGATPRILNSLK